jgi:multidrug efflux pump subunit AcrB
VIDTVVIETVVASNDPDEIERLVTVPIEQALQQLNGFEKTESLTSQGSVRIEIFFARTPSPEAVKQIEFVVHATWSTFSLATSKPLVYIPSTNMR